MGNIQKVENYAVDKENRPAGERYVSMSNALTRSGHGLTLTEKRIVAAAVSKLDSKRQPKPNESPVIRLTAAEYAEAFGVDSTTAYQQLESASKNLYNRSISFFDPSHTRKGKPLDVKTTMRWVGQATYHQNEGWVELHFWHAVVPHLMGLAGNFTQYQLQQGSALRSAYSWRLLELLMRYKKTGWTQIDIDDFAVGMDATEKQRADFAKLRTKIIEPAVKELTEKDNWVIEWKPIKAGRKVVAVHFAFHKNPQEKLPLDGESPMEESLETDLENED